MQKMNNGMDSIMNSMNEDNYTNSINLDVSLISSPILKNKSIKSKNLSLDDNMR